MARLSLKISNGQPMFYFADNGPGHGVNPFVPVPVNQAAPSPDNSVKDTDRLVQIPESSGPGVVYILLQSEKQEPVRSI